MPDTIAPWVVLVDTETVTVDSESGRQALLLGRYEVWRVNQQTGIPSAAKRIKAMQQQPFMRGLFFHEDDLYILLRSLGQARCVAHNWQFDASVIRLGSSVTRRKFGYSIDMENNTSFPIDKGYAPFNVQITWGGESYTQFLDNTNFHKTSLAKLGESFGIAKLPMPDLTPDLLNIAKALPQDTKNWLCNMDSQALGHVELEQPYNRLAEVIKYCTRDVEVLREAWFSLFRFSWELANVTPSFTVASMSKRVFQRRWLPAFHKQSGERFIGSLEYPAVAHAEECAFHGGRTDVLWNGKPKTESGVVNKYDVNSMYPSVMRARMPVQFIGVVNPVHALNAMEVHRDGSTGEAIYLCDVTVKIPTKGLGFIGWEGVKVQGKGLCFPAGEFRVWAWQPMVAIAREQGWIVEIHSALKYRARSIFKTFVEEIYALRKEAKANNDGPKALLLKYVMNSLYGKFGQRKFGQWVKLNPACDDYRIQKFSRDSFGDGFCRWKAFPEGNPQLLQMDYLETEDGIYRYEPAEEGMGINSICAIAGYITAMARAKLWDAMAYIITTGHTVYMTDTDSLVTDGALPDSWVSNELGDWTLEETSPAHECSFHAPKHYTFGNLAKIKGIRQAKPGINEYDQVQFSRWQTDLLSTDPKRRDRIEIGAFVKSIHKVVTGDNRKRRVLGDNRPSYPLVFPLK